MSRRPRRLAWDMPERPPARHPVRDSLIVYGALALVVVVFALVTGGSLVKALVVAAVFFAVAVVWVVWSSRRRSGSED